MQLGNSGFTGVDRAARGTAPLVYEASRALPLLGEGPGGVLFARIEVDPGGNGQPSHVPAAGAFLTLNLATTPAVVAANANGPYTGHASVPIAFSSAGSAVPTGMPVHFSWNFGDGSPEVVEASPSHAYAASGTYTATLRITITRAGITYVSESTAEVEVRPTVQVRVLPAGDEGRCDGVSVTARDRDLTTQHFQVRLTNAHCVAGFDLPLGRSFVFSVRNTLTTRFSTWPNATLGANEVDPQLPARLGVVCRQMAGGEACISEILQAASYEVARLSATPLTGPRKLDLQFRFTGRVIPCTLPGAVGTAFAHALVPLPGGYAQPDLPPPALGLFIGPAGPADPCILKSIPEGELAVVEAVDEAGTVFRGLIGRTSSSPVALEADPEFYRVDYIVDDPDDNPAGKDDIGLTRFGLLRHASNPNLPGATMLLRVSLRKVQATGNTHLNVVVREIRGLHGQVLLPASVEIRVLCSRHRGGCWGGQTLPGGVASRVRVGGVIAASGNGYADIRIDFSGVRSARFRLRAGVADGYDDAPDLSEEAKQWVYPGSGNSFTVSF